MNVIGFNFTKIGVSREKVFPKKFSLGTDIEFTDMSKEQIDVIKDLDSVKVDFRYVINYKEGEDKKSKVLAKIDFEGTILLSVSKEESKEILKNWKNKKPSQNLKVALFNFILKKCTVKALALEEEIGIPSHNPHAVPQIRIEKKD